MINTLGRTELRPQGDFDARRTSQTRGSALRVRINSIEVMTVLLFGFLVALVIGYVAGLVSFKIKDRWCPQCGSTAVAREQVRRAR
ncbi:hypothetical protein ACFFMR_29085 [Micromonospora andamanensis]|uniref:hypothetical protein n=1 Tax=Micromonospora andamanensis TaxID=1287068 RepID=UPI00194E4B19|nr:hypothetical protein [Micromonospora andamanensis]